MLCRVKRRSSGESRNSLKSPKPSNDSRRSRTYSVQTHNSALLGQSDRGNESEGRVRDET